MGIQLRCSLFQLNIEKKEEEERQEKEEEEEEEDKLTTACPYGSSGWSAPQALTGLRVNLSLLIVPLKKNFRPFNLPSKKANIYFKTS